MDDPIIELGKKIAEIVITISGISPELTNTLKEVGITNKSQLLKLQNKITLVTGVIIPFGRLAGGTDTDPNYTRIVPEIVAYIKDTKDLEDLRRQVETLKEKLERY